MKKNKKLILRIELKLNKNFCAFTEFGFILFLQYVAYDQVCALVWIVKKEIESWQTDQTKLKEKKKKN